MAHGIIRAFQGVCLSFLIWILSLLILYWPFIILSPRHEIIHEGQESKTDIPRSYFDIYLDDLKPHDVPIVATRGYFASVTRARARARVCTLYVSFIR